MLDYITKYNSDTILSGHLKSGLFSPTPKLELKFMSNRIMTIKPTQACGLDVRYIVGDYGIVNPAVMEVSDELAIHDDKQYHPSGASDDSLIGIRFLKITKIETYAFVGDLIETVKFYGDIDFDRLGKRIHFGAKILRGIQQVEFDILPSTLSSGRIGLLFQ